MFTRIKRKRRLEELFSYIRAEHDMTKQLAVDTLLDLAPVAPVAKKV